MSASRRERERERERQVFCDVTGCVLSVAVVLVLLPGRYRRAVACIKYN